MAYITNYNFKKVFKKVWNSKHLNGTYRNEQIYPDLEKFCQSFFSNYEKEELIAFKEFVDDPNFYITEYLKCVGSDDTLLYLNDHKPAYHSREDCDALLSDFVGLLIPDVIRAKGIEAVKKFRTFFKENEDLYYSNPEAFEARASLIFHAMIKITTVTKANSGAHEFQDVNIDILKNEIKGIWTSLKSWLDDPKLGKMRKMVYANYRQKTFLVYSKYAKNPIINNRTGYTDDQVRTVLQELLDNFKTPMMEKLKNFYMISVNPTIELNGNLLERLGFVKCKSCA